MGLSCVKEKDCLILIDLANFGAHVHNISLVQPIRARASISAANRLIQSSPTTTPNCSTGLAIQIWR
ncbi:MAG: hypothetical protein EBZ96_10285 [Synechococcaceae bacterium WB9_3_282]|nr:hypothetical protein [Synechococcaceae bacterium WB9_3_282]